jgi:iron complex transport system substrate-binding protein
MEVLVERNPDVIIVSTKHGVGGPTIEGVKTLLAGKNIAAVENNRVYGVDTDLTGRAGPRIVEGLETMARYIHPELFG